MKKLLMSVILCTLLLAADTIFPSSAQLPNVDAPYQKMSDPIEWYDLTDANDTAVILNFNGTDSLYLDQGNSTYLSSFWTLYTPNVTGIICDTLSTIIDTHSAELGNISKNIVFWGYPDNFNTTFVVQENLTAPPQLFNYFVDVVLPQPQGFSVAWIAYYITFNDTTDEPNDAFLYFHSSVTPIPPGFDADTTHIMVPHSWWLIPVAIGLIALTVGLKSCSDSKKAHQETKKQLDEMNKKIDEINKKVDDQQKNKKMKKQDTKRQKKKAAIDYKYNGYVDGSVVSYVLTVPTEVGVGGIQIPIDKLTLLAPYIGLASTILVATVVTAICIKRVKRRKEKQ